MVGRRLAQHARHPQRQRQGRDQQRRDMHERLRAHRTDLLQRMRVAVADQERRLEEGDRRIPDRRAAAQQRQDQLGDHRLDQEHQAGAGERGHREKDRRDRSGWPFGSF